MESFRQNLDAGGQARAGPREIAVRFEGVDAIVANGGYRVPLIRKFHGVIFISGLLGAVAAWGNEYDVGRSLHDILQRDTKRGVTWAAENVDAAGTLNHFGHPMPANVERLQPFEERHTRVTGNVPEQALDTA